MKMSLEYRLNKSRLFFHELDACHALQGKNLQSKVDKRRLEFEASPSPLIHVFVDSSPSSVIDLLAALASHKRVAVSDARASEEIIRQQIRIIGESLRAGEPFSEPAPLSSPPDFNSHCKLVLFSSGSIGEPKAIQLSVDNILASSSAIQKALSFEKATHQNIFLSLSYSFGLLGHLLPGLSLEMDSHIFKDYASARNFWTKTRFDGMWCGILTHAKSWLRQEFEQADFRSLRLVFAGQAIPSAVRSALLEKFQDAFISVNYGLTEGSSRVLSLNNSDPQFVSDQSGYLVGDWKGRINNAGELELSGPQKMLGYLNSHHDDQRCRSAESEWLLTRDQAEVDEKGCYRILGRADSIRFVGSQKIDLYWLEAALNELDGVREAVCVAQAGNSLLIFVESSHSNEVVTRTVDQFLTQKSLRQGPKTKIIAMKLPRLSNNKVDRKFLSHHASSSDEQS